MGCDRDGQVLPKKHRPCLPRRCSEFRVEAGSQSGNCAAVRTRDSKHTHGRTPLASAALAPDLFQYPQSRCEGRWREQAAAESSEQPPAHSGAQGLAPAPEQPAAPPPPWPLSQVTSSRWDLKNRGETLEEKSHKITKRITTTPPGTPQNLQRERGDSCSRSSLSATSTGRCVDQRQAACSRMSPPSVPRRPDAVPSGVGVFALGTRAESRGSATPTTAVCGPVTEEGAGALRLTSQPHTCHGAVVTLEGHVLVPTTLPSAQGSLLF